VASAVEQLRSYMDVEDPYDYDTRTVDKLRLEAANERLQAMRQHLPVLEQRASAAAGVDGIERSEDLTPLLFAHSNYKSYPESFMAQGRWDRMNAWLDTLSTVPGVRQVDVSGVTDVDDWLARLHDNGHFAFATSGTTGKCSVLDQSSADRADLRRIMEVNIGWGTGLKAAQDRPVFVLAPKHGFFRFVEGFAAVSDAFGRPGDVHYLIDEPMRVADANRLGALRRAMASGTAQPSEIAAAQETSAARAAEMNEALLGLVDTILEHRHEPLIIQGMWPQHFAIAEAARRKGVGDGEFHPDTVIGAGGGRKGTVLPDDFKDRVLRFYGLSRGRAQEMYGMSEMSTSFPMCTSGRFHTPPWIHTLILDAGGEQLLNPTSGVSEGRMAFFDALIGGRWGGMITGDRVTADWDRCACGRSGQTILPDIVRYSEIEGGDDKLTCAGTIESYIRGQMEI